MIKAPLYIIPVIWILCLTQLSEAAPRVILKNGTYIGLSSPSFQQDLFLGMPYASAKQPIGNRRLRVPESLDSTWPSPRTTLAFGNSCPQPPVPPFTTDNMVYGGDCLTLNVVRPAGIPNLKKLPVAVWIHGAWPYTNISTFVNASQQAGTPIIAVSINYRLGILGFLAGSELTREGNINLGLHDQRMALRWVHENNASFGGDPEKVTIFGESAGGMSVACQMAMFGGRNDRLFRGAILESGTISTLPWDKSDSDTPNSIFSIVASKVGCGNVTDKVGCIRSAPYQKILDAFDIFKGTFFITPTIDGNLFKENPIKSFNEGRIVKIPTLLGTTQDEGAIIPPGLPPNTDEDVIQGFAALFPYFTNADFAELLRLYPNDPSQGIPYGRFGNTTFPALGLQWRRFTSIGGDILIVSGERWTSKILSSSDSEVYKYRFNVSTNLLGFPDIFGAIHSVELPYVFNIPELRQSAELSKVVDVMSRTWISFVNCLTPNEHGLEGVPFWPPYKRKNQEYVVRINSIRTELDRYREKGIEFITSVTLRNAGIS